MKVAEHPFVFCTQLHLRELTGVRAKSLDELLSCLRTVPGACIYHHTHHFLQRHQYLSPEPPNDFAYWVAEALGEDRIGERLAAVDTLRYASIRELREKTIAVLEQERERRPEAFSRQAPENEAFDFVKSVSVVFPTSQRASTLAEFLEGLGKVTIFSLYYHIFAARLRLERATNDFSRWLQGELGEALLASQIAKLDPYTHTMEGLRMRIASLVRARLMAGEGSLTVAKPGEAR
jgi:hypothetical protein